MTRHDRPSPASRPTRFISLSLSLASRDELTDGLGVPVSHHYKGFISSMTPADDDRRTDQAANAVPLLPLLCTYHLRYILKYKNPNSNAELRPVQNTSSSTLKSQLSNQIVLKYSGVPPPLTHVQEDFSYAFYSSYGSR